MKYLFFTITIGFAFSCGSPVTTEESQEGSKCISNPSRNAESVYLTQDIFGNPLISWCESDESNSRPLFYFSFSTKDGIDFCKPILIPTPASVSTHTEGMPKVAMKGNGDVVAVYQVSTPTPEDEWASYIGWISSSDSGKTWTQEKYLHSDTTLGKQHSFFDLVLLPDGEIGAAWLDISLDPAKGGRTVRFARTEGDRFVNELVVDSAACECCRVAIACSDEGHIAVMFRDILPTNIRDMSVCYSSDTGNTFSSPQRLSNDNWEINACPHNGPSIALENETMYCAWFTGAEKSGVYFAAGDVKEIIAEQELINADAHHVQVRCFSHEVYRVWDESVAEGENSYSRICLEKMKDGQLEVTEYITRDTEHCTYPVVAVNDKHVIIAYSQRESDRNQIRYVIKTR